MTIDDLMQRIEETEPDADSMLEGNGFERSVPRRARTADSATLVCRCLIRAVSDGAPDPARQLDRFAETGNWLG
jgi:hypothetical protein